MRRVDSCAPYGWSLILNDSQLEGTARAELRERVKQLDCREIDVHFLVASKTQLYWSTQSPYYGTVEIPICLFSWIDYYRPEVMLPEDCVSIRMNYLDPSNTVTGREQFHITVDFDEFMAICGDLVSHVKTDVEDRRKRIKETGEWPLVS